MPFGRAIYRALFIGAAARSWNVFYRHLPTPREGAPPHTFLTPPNPLSYTPPDRLYPSPRRAAGAKGQDPQPSLKQAGTRQGPPPAPHQGATPILLPPVARPQRRAPPGNQGGGSRASPPRPLGIRIQGRAQRVAPPPGHSQGKRRAHPETGAGLPSAFAAFAQPPGCPLRPAIALPGATSHSPATAPACPNPTAPQAPKPPSPHPPRRRTSTTPPSNGSARDESLASSP